MDITIQLDDCDDLMHEDSIDPHELGHLAVNNEENDSTITENSMVELEVESSGCMHSEIVQSKPILISAMKGGRKQIGLYVEKLTVTWAPDVYDPPVTSRSHSVVRTCSRQFSKSSKKSVRSSHKSKNTTKSTRHIIIAKKQYRKTVNNHCMPPMLPIAGCEMLGVGGISQSSVGLVNLGVF